MSLTALRQARRLDRLYDRIRHPDPRVPIGTVLLWSAALLVPPGLAILIRNTGHLFDPFGWERHFIRLSLYSALATAAVLGLWVASRNGAIRTTSFAALRAPNREMLRLARLLGNVPSVIMVSVGWGAATALLLPGTPGTPFLAATVPLLQMLLGYLDAILQERIRHAWFSRIIRFLSRVALPLMLLLLWELLGTLPLPAPLEYPAYFACMLVILFMLIPGPVTEPSTDGEPMGEFLPQRDPLKLGGMRPARTRLPRTHPGRRGMVGAMFVRFRASLRIRKDRHFVPDLLWNLFHGPMVLLGPLFGVLAALNAGSNSGLAERSLLPLDALLAIGAGAAPRILGLPPSGRLWLLGVDARAQVQSNLKVFLLLAALPTMLATAVTIVVTGPGLRGVVLLFFLASIFLGRAGVEVSGRSAEKGSLSFLWLVLLVPLPLVPLGIETIWVLMGAAALLLAFGLKSLIVWFRTATDETEAQLWLDDDSPDSAASAPVP